MNRGVLNKSLREVWFLTALCGVAIAALEALLAYIFWTYEDQLTEEIMEIEFVRNIVGSLISTEIEGMIGPEALRALPWAHPIILALIWAHEITLCTRVPAGEIDRGTIDLLLGLPVSRFRVFVTETLVWMTAGLVVVSLGLFGSFLGNLTIPQEDWPDFGHLSVVLLNLYALYLTIGAATFLFSALSDRRGRAVGAAFALVLVMFIWNFLGQYWSVASDYAWLSVMHFYKPLPMLMEGEFPTRDVTVLLACAVVLWTAAAVILNRRDISTT